MLKRCYSLIFIVFLLLSCSHHQRTSTAPVQSYKNGQQHYRAVEAFNQVNVAGRVNVRLHTGYKKPQLLLIGDPRDVAQVRTVVKDGALYLSLGAGYPRFGEVTADVQGRFLNKFNYQGGGVITGDRLHTRALDLYIDNAGTTRLGGDLGIQDLVVKGDSSVLLSGVNSYDLKVKLIGSPKVQINGVINLSHLTINGNGWLSMYWVKSHNLTIVASKKAKIQLAGIANRLEVELWNSAQFKGRYLRAQRSFVKTHNKSVAEISAVNHQSSLANDVSDIYYYNIPNTRADFMAKDGSILDMRAWSEYDTEGFTRYNKQFP